MTAHDIRVINTSITPNDPPPRPPLIFQSFLSPHVESVFIPETVSCRVRTPSRLPFTDSPVKVGMEDFTATRPTAVIVLDLESEADVLARVSGRRVDMATGG